MKKLLILSLLFLSGCIPVRHIHINQKDFAIKRHRIIYNETYLYSPFYLNNQFLIGPTILYQPIRIPQPIRNIRGHRR